jgi:hypothetical protein
MTLRRNPSRREPNPGAADPAIATGDDQLRTGLRELLERQRVELEGHVAEAERLVAETQAHAEADATRQGQELARLQRVLEARAEEGQRLREQHARERAELEDRATQLQAQIEEIQRTLHEERSEREAREADLERRLEEAGMEHSREHRLRRELEQELDRQAAATTAHATRLEDRQRELQDACAQVRDHAERQRVERQLAAVDRSESDGLPSSESTGRVPPDAGAGSGSASPNHATSDAPRASEPEALEAEMRALATPEHTSDDPPPDWDAAGSEVTRGRRLRFARRWRRRSSLPCAVCSRPPAATSDSEATTLGWVLTGAGALCPACQQRGWRFPPGAAVPFRSLDSAEPRSSG